MTLCILHLGSEKTGTSSIQKYFGIRRAALLQKGIWYPRSFANPASHVHLKLSRAALTGALNDEAPEVVEFRKEYESAAKAGVSVALFSSEFFHSEMREAAALERLREFLEKFFDSFQLIYYARRQDEMLASMHSTAVKGGWTTDPHALSVYESKGHYYFDHQAVCDLWSAQFGRENLVCRIFEREKLIGGDIVDDFAHAIGLERGTGSSHVSANESLSFETMSALLYLNASPDRDNRELRRKLVARGRKRNGTRVPMVTKGEAKDFYARFRDSNRHFFDGYVDKDLATGFSEDFSNFPDALPEMPLADVKAFIFGKK
ncbi:MAG TPA: hypothetical protein VMF58_03510 [Rhizomicrobium sp.]|nr:hypothetical protein [Rhizomicrobium sp.]